MYHFFIHAATLLTICLAADRVPPDIKTRNPTKPELHVSNFSSDTVTLEKFPNNGIIDDFTRFVRRKLSTDVKQKLSDFTLKKQPYTPLIDPNIKRGLSVNKKIKSKNFKNNYEDSFDAASNILEIVGLANEFNFNEEFENPATERFVPIESISVPPHFPVTGKDITEEASIEIDNDEMKVLKKNMKTDAFLTQFSTTKNFQIEPFEYNDIKTRKKQNYDNLRNHINMNGNLENYKESQVKKERNYANEIFTEGSSQENDSLNYNFFGKVDINNKLTMAKQKYMPNYTKKTTVSKIEETTDAYEDLRRKIFNEVKTKSTTRRKQLVTTRKRTKAPTTVSKKDRKEKQKFSKILNRENEIINILRKQTELLERVAKVLDKDMIRSRNDFEKLLSELDKKKQTIDKGTNMTQAAVETVKEKLKMLQQQEMAAKFTETTITPQITKKRMLPTIKTLVDETDIRDALKKDPYVRRIIKMAKNKRNQYVNDAKKYFGLY